MKSIAAWQAYSKSGKRPTDIPSDPSRTYTKRGWVNWGDWLATGKISNSLRQFQSFENARAFVRRLGFKTRKEWYDYCKSGKKPADIPTNPNRTYAQAGWAGIGDWLGTGAVANFLREYRPFKDARTFVRSLGLKSQSEWSRYCKSGRKPADIPAKPARKYAKTGWVNWGDWLGTGRVADQLREYRSFKKARAFVRGLGLKSRDEWRAYCKSGKKPVDIPALPNNTYAEAGWIGMADWLGTIKHLPAH